MLFHHIFTDDVLFFLDINVNESATCINSTSCYYSVSVMVEEHLHIIHALKL